MPKEVKADAALETSPSAANVSARRALTFNCSSRQCLGGLVLRLEVSLENAVQRESMSPARSALQRETTSSWMLRSGVRIGPRRGGTLRHSLAGAARSAHA